MKYAFSAAATLTCLLIGWNTSSMAQPVPPGNPALLQLAEMTGGVTAGIKSCGIEGNVGPKKDEQRAQFLQMGGTPEQFDTGYKAGYDRAISEYKAASAGDRQNMCAKLSAFLSAQ